ncbi:hypothetical protein [Halobacillus sp. Nhm2S1]|uniref:hypothetical protein n=1 Tax=Halobacillus sp. Nhm2S1 TaxID=2866716 RepID=UPI001C73CE02|nr:hypothetical protein [Halobacillus sp. Nhm2S1]MBX0356107.1 hypothetical protein [Halobacillus sp. Nhm2S1]
MERLHTIWLDDTYVHGIIKIYDSIFEYLFHPIVLDEIKGEYRVINNLWYTTYHGAREFFRSPSNPYSVVGRMKVKEETTVGGSIVK